VGRGGSKPRGGFRAHNKQCQRMCAVGVAIPLHFSQMTETFLHFRQSAEGNLGDQEWSGVVEGNN